MDYLIHPLVTRHYPGRVSPFGDLRIKAYLRLPEAFRSLSRPSSAISALASTLRSSSLDLACFLLLPKTYCFRSLMEEGSHCVYLGYIVAVSLPLRNLDWILTFSSFRFIFPVQFSRCMLKNLADPSKRYSVSIKIPIRFLPSRAQQISLSLCGICTTFSYFNSVFTSLKLDLGYD